MLGARLDDANNGATRSAVALAYDPHTDEWRVLPSTDFVPQASTIAWTGKAAVASDYTLTARSYDPRTNAWNAIRRPPITPGGCYPSSASVSNLVVG